MKNVMNIFKGKTSIPIIMLVSAILIAGIASVSIYTILKKKTVAKEAATDVQVIAVSAFDMKWGTVISREFVNTKPYLKTSLPAGYIADPAAAVGRVVLYPIRADEPITESRLAPRDIKSGGLAAVVTPKKRAMGVKVDKVVGVSGFIHPGNRVDVLVSLPKSDKTSTSITKIVLENIPVLAIGAEVEQSTGKKEKASPVDVITLEVTPEEGERLALAAVEGKLQLALRNHMDTEDAKTKGTTIPQLLGTPVGEAVREKKIVVAARRNVTAVKHTTAPAPAAVKAYTVELIKGTKSSYEKLTVENE